MVAVGGGRAWRLLTPPMGSDGNGYRLSAYTGAIGQSAPRQCLGVHARGFWLSEAAAEEVTLATESSLRCFGARGSIP